MLLPSVECFFYSPGKNYVTPKLQNKRFGQRKLSMNISCVLGCKAADLSVDSSLENTDEKQPTT